MAGRCRPNWREVGESLEEQQRQVLRLARLTDCLLEAHCSLLQAHNSFVAQHTKLCHLLEKRGVLGREDIAASADKLRLSGSLGTLLEDGSISRAILLAAGTTAAGCLGSCSHTCQLALTFTMPGLLESEALAAEQRFSAAPWETVEATIGGVPVPAWWPVQTKPPPANPPPAKSLPPALPAPLMEPPAAKPPPPGEGNGSADRSGDEALAAAALALEWRPASSPALPAEGGGEQPAEGAEARPIEEGPLSVGEAPAAPAPPGPPVGGGGEQPAEGREEAVIEEPWFRSALHASLTSLLGERSMSRIRCASTGAYLHFGMVPSRAPYARRPQPLDPRQPRATSAPAGLRDHFAATGALATGSVPGGRGTAQAMAQTALPGVPGGRGTAQAMAQTALPGVPGGRGTAQARAQTTSPGLNKGRREEEPARGRRRRSSAKADHTSERHRGEKRQKKAARLRISHALAGLYCGIPRRRPSAPDALSNASDGEEVDSCAVPQPLPTCSPRSDRLDKAAEAIVPTQIQTGCHVRLVGHHGSTRDGNEGKVIRHLAFQGLWHVRLHNGEVLQARKDQLELLPYPIVNAAPIGPGPSDTQASLSVEAGSNAVHGTKIFICGGFDGAESSSAASAFDVATHSWEVLPPMTVPRAMASTASLDGQVYVCGGISRHPLRSAERFDPATGEWEALPPMRLERLSAAAAVLGGRLYVCGGRTQGHDSTAAVERFDPKIGEWQEMPSMRVGRFNGRAEAKCGRLYVCGGLHCLEGNLICTPSNQPSPVASVECFAPDVGWEELPKPEKARDGLATACSARYLYLCGGKDEGKCLDSVERWDFISNVWQSLPPMAEKRTDCAAVTSSGGQLYVCGGEDGNRALASLERFDPLPGTWSTLQIPRFRRAALGAAMVLDRLYVFGGHDRAWDASAKDELSLGLRRQRGSLCRARCCTSGCLGRCMGQVVCGQSEVFDIEGGRWKLLPLMPRALTQLQGACVRL